MKKKQEDYGLDLDEVKNEEYDEPKFETDNVIATQNNNDFSDYTNENRIKTNDEIVTQSKEKDGQYTENDRLQSTNTAINIACQSVKTSPYSNIPDELKSLNQWVVYRTYPDKDGKL
jgi:hypothetical protein